MPGSFLAQRSRGNGVDPVFCSQVTGRGTGCICGTGDNAAAISPGHETNGGPFIHGYRIDGMAGGLPFH